MMSQVIVIDNWTSVKAEAIEAGYISTTLLIQLTGVTMRRLNYWEVHGVFGPPLQCGSGKRRLWHKSIVPRVAVLAEIANSLGSNSHMSLSLMRDIFNAFDQGCIRLTDKVMLTWET